MVTVSLCIIVKNEESSLPRCLASVRDVVDELIVVDTGSTDGTKSAAAAYGAKLYDFEWVDDFSAARNFAFGQATQQFIMWLDADDVLEEADRARFRALKELPELPYDSITMKYHLSFDDQNRPVHSLRRNRLVRRSCQFRWHGAVHEYLAVAGRQHHSDIAITHRKEREHTDRNLQLYRRRKERGELFEPRDQYYFGNELLDHGLHLEAAGQYEQFLDGGLGWSQDQIAACGKLAYCYRTLNQPGKQVQALLRAFAYDTPSAEICCQLGSYFAEKRQFPQAVHWYRQATLLERPDDAMSMTDQSAWTWLPHLQLTYCYDKLGFADKAKIHHDMAKMFYPNHPSVLYNETYFSSQQ